MRKCILILVLLLVGCIKSPVDPQIPESKFDGPPVLYLSFDQTTQNLKSSTEVKLWIDSVGANYNGYGVGWGNSDPGSTEDNAKNLAYNFWLSHKDGKNLGPGGICGNFAGFFTYCMRIHGYKTGLACWYRWNPDGSDIVGHAIGWVQERDGSVSTLSNDLFSYKQFNSLKEFKACFDRQWNTSCSYVSYMNDHAVYMTAQEINETF